MSEEYLFVYGSLRRAAGHPLHALLEDRCILVGDGFMQGCLYLVADYPGAIESPHPHDRVCGEVYKCPSESREGMRQGKDRAELLSLLDDYEECSERFAKPHEYERKKVAITLNGNIQVNAWVYLYNRPVTGLREIPGGDYIRYLRTRGKKE